MASIRVVILHKDGECLEELITCFVPLALLLGNPAQLVQGRGLSVTVVEVDVDLQGLLEVLLCLLELPLLLGNHAQMVQDTSMIVTVVEVDEDRQGLLEVLLCLLELPLLLGNPAQLVVDACTQLSHPVGIIVRVLKPKGKYFLIGCFCFCIMFEQKVPLGNVIENTNDFCTKGTCLLLCRIRFQAFEHHLSQRQSTLLILSCVYVGR